MDITIDGIDSNDKLDEINIEKDIIDYLKKNKESLSNILGQDVTDEMISEAYKDFERRSKELFNTHVDSIKQWVRPIKEHELHER